MRILAALLPALLLLNACSNNLPESCSLKPESGKCRAAITRWSFDEQSRTCRPFIWGGCDGVVPFETLDSCQTQCMVGKPLPAVAPVLKNSPAAAESLPAAGSSSAAP